MGFLKWLQARGWWGEERIHLCAGGVQDLDSVRVDIQNEIPLELRESWGKRTGQGHGRRLVKTNANLLADARDTGLDPESFDWVGIDPPYSKDLAKKLYGTEYFYSGIDAFLKEGWRLVRPGGYVMTFCYEISKMPSIDAKHVACWGIYQIPAVRYMTCMNVWQKQGHLVQGLDKWVDA